ncbi:hypothetical protein HPG69_003964 [Diceros bicornis minor]|uniref:Uncharacterized protein n=1 Tax=Diceros bicornis minor TaxID=77932 RepID=A0A7J7EEN7_DICBM|nr:hypothetical protein HPG69_003964 [Diceros bicornis minor]
MRVRPLVTTPLVGKRAAREGLYYRREGIDTNKAECATLRLELAFPGLGLTPAAAARTRCSASGENYNSQDASRRQRRASRGPMAGARRSLGASGVVTCRRRRRGLCAREATDKGWVPRAGGRWEGARPAPLPGPHSCPAVAGAPPSRRPPRDGPGSPRLVTPVGAAGERLEGWGWGEGPEGGDVGETASVKPEGMP